MKTMVYEHSSDYRESNFAHFSQPCAADLVRGDLVRGDLVRGGSAEPPGGTRYGRIGGQPYGYVAMWLSGPLT